MTAYLDGYSGYSGVSEDAAAEILEKLMTHQQISSDEVAQILKPIWLLSTFAWDISEAYGTSVQPFSAVRVTEDTCTCLLYTSECVWHKAQLRAG